MNAAIVPESCPPYDLVCIIRAGLKMDNETFDKYGLGTRHFVLARHLEVFLALLIHMSRMNEFLPSLEPVIQ